LLGTFVGFGTGHIVYGQYLNKGWIFTLGEGVGYGLIVAGLVNVAADSVSNSFSCGFGSCNNSTGGTGLITAGLVVYLGFHIWEIIDVWTFPGSYNARYQAIKTKAETAEPKHASDLMVLPLVEAPTTRGGGVPMGLQVSWSF
jgi:hypothetical protein